MTYGAPITYVPAENAPWACTVGALHKGNKITNKNANLTRRFIAIPPTGYLTDAPEYQPVVLLFYSRSRQYAWFDQGLNVVPKVGLESRKGFRRVVVRTSPRGALTLGRTRPLSLPATGS